jgi:hypothetical protein
VRERDCVKLTWENPAGADRDGIKVEASINGAPFCEISDLPADAAQFTNTGMNDPSTIRYRIRAYNRGGYSPYSDIASSQAYNSLPREREAGSEALRPAMVRYETSSVSHRPQQQSSLGKENRNDL